MNFSLSANMSGFCSDSHIYYYITVNHSWLHTCTYRCLYINMYAHVAMFATKLVLTEYYSMFNQ